eukprot:108365_1
MLIFLFSSTLFTLIASSVHQNPHDHSDTKEEYVEIYSYCDPTNSNIHQNNGLYYIKPFPNGLIIPVICCNGYIMIDPSLDLNNISSYDTCTFREWWLPADG